MEITFIYLFNSSGFGTHQSFSQYYKSTTSANWIRELETEVVKKVKSGEVIMTFKHAETD